MNDPDASIDRVIAGLRESEPSAGMNTRILRALEGRAAAPTGATWRRWKLAAVAIACAAGVVLVLMVPRMEHRPVQLASAPSAVSAASPKLDSTAQNAKIAPRRMQAQFAEPATNDIAHPHRAKAMAPRLVLAVDQPAPPLPLTEQERLLLQLAQHRRVETLELLNPEQQAKQLAKNNEQFQQFFAEQTEEETLAQRPGGQ